MWRFYLELCIFVFKDIEILSADIDILFGDVRIFIGDMKILFRDLYIFIGYMEISFEDIKMSNTMEKNIWRLFEE